MSRKNSALKDHKKYKKETSRCRNFSCFPNIHAVHICFFHASCVNSNVWACIDTGCNTISIDPCLFLLVRPSLPIISILLKQINENTPSSLRHSGKQTCFYGIIGKGYSVSYIQTKESAGKKSTNCRVLLFDVRNC